MLQRPEYEGQAAKFAASASGSAVALVRNVLEKLPGFRDTVVCVGASSLAQVLHRVLHLGTDRSYPLQVSCRPPDSFMKYLEVTGRVRVRACVCVCVCVYV